MKRKININGQLYEAVQETYLYGCEFELLGDVLDRRAAQKYLDSDYKLMLNIFNDDTLEGTGLKDDPIVRWRWVLEDDFQGWFLYETNRELSRKEIKNLSDATTGQASDGLGEGFEQQPFAEYMADDSSEDEEEWIICSFDWEYHGNQGYSIRLLNNKVLRDYLKK